MPRLSRVLASSFAVAFLALAAPVSEARRIDPMWSVDGIQSVAIPPGFANVAGSYAFQLGGGDASLSLNYDVAGRLAGGGFAAVPDPGGGVSVTNYALTGVWAFDAAAGKQTVHLADSTKSPTFVFDGEVAADGAQMVGTYQRHPGFLGIAGDESGALTMQRTDGPARTAFTLKFTAVMDARGHVRGALDGRKETTADITVYGTRLDATNHPVDVKLTGGKVRGTVATNKYAVTTAKLTVTGRGWKVKLVGPVDADGFHAVCDFSGGHFKFRGAHAELAARFFAPPPPPIPPKNLLAGATASVVDGKLKIVHAGVPSKFFGATSRLVIEVPVTDVQAIVDGHAIVHADPSSATLPDPDARRCTATVRGRDYGTSLAPADVTLDFHQFVAQVGGAVEVLATGAVVAENGAKKAVSVTLRAVLQ